MSRPLPESLIQAAITWSVRLQYSQPSDQDQLAFEQWLQASPLHGLAWQRVSGLRGFQAELGSLPPRLARDTLKTAQDLRASRHATRRRSAIKLLSGAGMTVAMAWLVREHAPWQRLLADASTGVGEQKTLHLEDGSVIVLNTDSAVAIDLAGADRLVTLRRGEILVTTGSDTAALARRDARRPFWVNTPFGRIQALGTRFTVRLAGGRARVSVQEGAVQLYPGGGADAVVVVSGDSRWLLKGASLAAEPLGFAPDGWAEGVIGARNIRLQDLLAEMERYRHGRIVCDPGVAELRISGLFHINDTDRALQFLEQTQGLSVSYRTPWWVTVGPGARHRP